MIDRRVTFVLPGDNRSGGVRVTALMGNLLTARKYEVRIVYRNPGLFSVQGARDRIAEIGRRFRPAPDTGWLHTFSGQVESYKDLNALAFQHKEVVIAVGTYMVPEVFSLRKDVIKIRYNHGFPAKMTEQYRKAWSLPMHTITVSNTLVPTLEELSGQKVLAVIPNGIDTSDYFPIGGIRRDSIGCIYSVHPNKAPHDIIKLLARVGEAMPGIPRIVFGTERRPPELADCQYERFPSLERVRELYSGAVIWLLPSHTEGLPGPVLEAMACGAVVISTDNDGSLELIRDGVNGLIVPKGDIEAFIRRIGSVLSDSALRGRLVQGGFETVKKFRWAVAADRMEEFLHTVTQAKATANHVATDGPRDQSDRHAS